MKYRVVLREKRRIESPIFIGNKNLANILYNLLVCAKREVSIYLEKALIRFVK